MQKNVKKIIFFIKTSQYYLFNEYFIKKFIFSKKVHLRGQTG